MWITSEWPVDPDTIAEVTKRRCAALGEFSSRAEARSFDAIGLASAKGICHHLGFINCLANRGEHTKGDD